MTLLVWLILAHVLADFYWQPTHWVAQRQTRKIRAAALYQHAGVHFIATSGALLIGASLGQVSFSWNLLWAALAIAVGHLVIDSIKAYLRPSATALIVDQLAHLAVLVLVWGWLTGLLPFVQIWTLGFLLQRDHLILLTAYLIAAKPVSFFTATVLSRQARALAQSAQGLVEAGRMIGYVERWLIISFVLSGQFIGVGFLLAAKSIFRFGDLSQAHERRLTEYMLLGTLVSFISAIAIAGLAVYLTG